MEGEYLAKHTELVKQTYVEEFGDEVGMDDETLAESVVFMSRQHLEFMERMLEAYYGPSAPARPVHEEQILVQYGLLGDAALAAWRAGGLTIAGLLEIQPSAVILL